MQREIVRLRAVNNAHVSQEVHDLPWKIKEMRGEG
jgi:hypothetical protein